MSDDSFLETSPSSDGCHLLAKEWALDSGKLSRVACLGTLLLDITESWVRNIDHKLNNHTINITFSNYFIVNDFNVYLQPCR